jgi:hypothetical protein
LSKIRAQQRFSDTSHFSPRYSLVSRGIATCRSASLCQTGMLCDILAHFTFQSLEKFHRWAEGTIAILCIKFFGAKNTRKTAFSKNNFFPKHLDRFFDSRVCW